MRWLICTALIMCGLAGCSASPELSLVREGGGLTSARGTMYGIYNSGQRVASLNVEDGLFEEAPAEAPAEAESVGAKAPQPEDLPTAAPATTVACTCTDGTPCTRGPDGVCRRPDGTPCKCIAAPVGAAPTVSPVTWPTGCSLEYWSASYCGPCQRWYAEEYGKIPQEVVTKKDAVASATEASQKGVTSLPYFIFYCDGQELGRVRGYMTGESLIAKATELSRLPVSQNVGASGASSSLSIIGASTPLTGAATFVKAAPVVRSEVDILREHMRNDHGMDCSNMTDAQVQAAHNAVHNVGGYQSVGTTWTYNYSPGVKYTTRRGRR